VCLFLDVFYMPMIWPNSTNIMNIFQMSIARLAVGSFEKALRVRNAITGWKSKRVTNILTNLQVLHRLELL